MDWQRLKVLVFSKRFHLPTGITEQHVDEYYLPGTRRCTSDPISLIVRQQGAESKNRL